VSQGNIIPSLQIPKSYHQPLTTICNSYASVHGYFPASTALQAFLVVGIVMFVAGYLTAKLLALAVLTSSSISAAIGWCTAEALVLLALRFFCEGRVWRFHFPGLSTPLSSLMVHTAFYVSMLAAPFPILR
jgi:hypothetical protein